MIKTRKRFLISSTTANDTTATDTYTISWSDKKW